MLHHRNNDSQDVTPRFISAQCPPTEETPLACVGSERYTLHLYTQVADWPSEKLEFTTFVNTTGS